MYLIIASTFLKFLSHLALPLLSSSNFPLFLFLKTLPQILLFLALNGMICLLQLLSHATVFSFTLMNTMLAFVTFGILSVSLWMGDTNIVIWAVTDIVINSLAIAVLITQGCKVRVDKR